MTEVVLGIVFMVMVMMVVVLMLQMWKQSLAWGHAARNGRGRMQTQAVALSQDTSFLSNYARNAGSQVHLKSLINTDRAKEPLALTQICSPRQSDAHSRRRMFSSLLSACT